MGLVVHKQEERDGGPYLSAVGGRPCGVQTTTDGSSRGLLESCGGSRRVQHHEERRPVWRAPVLDEALTSGNSGQGARLASSRGSLVAALQDYACIHLNGDRCQSRVGRGGHPRGRTSLHGSRAGGVFEWKKFSGLGRRQAQAHANRLPKSDMLREVRQQYRPSCQSGRVFCPQQLTTEQVLSR